MSGLAASKTTEPPAGANDLRTINLEAWEFGTAQAQETYGGKIEHAVFNGRASSPVLSSPLGATCEVVVLRVC